MKYSVDLYNAKYSIQHFWPWAILGIKSEDISASANSIDHELFRVIPPTI